MKSSRKKATISGDIQLKFKLIDTAPESSDELIAQKWAQWVSSLAGSPSPVQQDEDPLARLGDDVDISDDDDSSPSPDDDVSASGKSSKKGKDKKDKKKKSKSSPFELNRGRDVVGVIFLEISSITDLPPEKNGMR